MHKICQLLSSVSHQGTQRTLTESPVTLWESICANVQLRLAFKENLSLSLVKTFIKRQLEKAPVSTALIK